MERGCKGESERKREGGRGVQEEKKRGEITCTGRGQEDGDPGKRKGRRSRGKEGEKEREEIGRGKRSE